MDGLTSFLLQAFPGQGLVISPVDISILTASLVLALGSALALARQIFFAITFRD